MGRLKPAFFPCVSITNVPQLAGDAAAAQALDQLAGDAAEVPMQALEVDKPYPGLRPPLATGSFFNWTAAAAELLLVFDGPSPAEAADVARGASEFALTLAAPAVWLLPRFGRAVRWSDAPFSVHLLPEDQRPDLSGFPSPESRLVLHVVLVDAATAAIKAMRAVSLSPDFSTALAAAVRLQLQAPWSGRAAYLVDLDAAYRAFPATDQLLRFASVRTAGGT